MPEVVSLALNLYPDELEARPTASQNGPAMFNGTAEVLRLPPGLRATVTLSASCDWSAIVSPSTMVFTEAGPQGFYVTVVVPPGESRGTRRELSVHGTAYVPLLADATASAFANVTVAAYYDVRIEDVRVDGSAERGSTVEVTLNVTNMCNFDLACHLELVGPPPGFSGGPTDTKTIPKFTHAHVTIAVYVGDGAAAGQSDVRIGVVYPEQAQGAPACHGTARVRVVPVAASAVSWGLVAALAIALAVVAALVVLLRRRRAPQAAKGREGAT